MTVEIFVQCVLGVLEKIEKSRDLAYFLSNFGLISAMFLTYQFYIGKPIPLSPLHI